MQSLKTAVLNMSVCALLGSLAELLSLRKNAGVMRAVTAALIVVMTASALSGGDISSIIPADDEPNGAGVGGGASRAAVLLEKKLYADIENMLISEGFDEYEIYTDVVADDSLNTVSLEKITVLAGCEFEELIPQLKKKLSELYTCTVTVGVKQNE